MKAHQKIIQPVKLTLTYLRHTKRQQLWTHATIWAHFFSYLKAFFSYLTHFFIFNPNRFRALRVYCFIAQIQKNQILNTSLQTNTIRTHQKTIITISADDERSLFLVGTLQYSNRKRKKTIMKLNSIHTRVKQRRWKLSPTHAWINLLISFYFTWDCTLHDP